MLSNMELQVGGNMLLADPKKPSSSSLNLTMPPRIPCTCTIHKERGKEGEKTKEKVNTNQRERNRTEGSIPSTIRARCMRVYTPATVWPRATTIRAPSSRRRRPRRPRRRRARTARRRTGW
uniref:Uncharacterized protein n=1 Tax=Arundo donax TaxID=35708 RepID=A0A0A9HK34_ARUDO